MIHRKYTARVDYQSNRLVGDFLVC